MPVPSSPPYASAAVIFPRQLNRWLDTNAQNGKLTRTKTYLTLPSFSLDVVYAGYRQIVASINFECANNFSLKVVASDESTLSLTSPALTGNVIRDVNGNPLLDVNGNVIYGI